MNNNQSPSIELTADILEEARERLKTIPVKKKSHRKEEGNEVGCIGEIVVELWLKKHGISYQSQLNKTSHDYLIQNKYQLEVKTKDRTVVPLPKYECTDVVNQIQST